MSFKSVLLAAVIFGASQAHAYKLVLLTDQAGAAKASAIKQLIVSTSPFKYLTPAEFTVDVQTVRSATEVACHSKLIKYTSAEIRGMLAQAKHQGYKISKEQQQKYRDGYTIDRLVECDRGALAEIGARAGASRVLFIHDSPFEGGSGGDIPIVLSGSGVGVGLHEWLHTFGLADEYAYPAEEAAFHCNSGRSINIAIFEAHSSYSGNADVIAQHSDVISWLDGLPKNAQLTTNGQLGSPAGKPLGIFTAKTCDNLTPRKQSWRATSYPSIMENTNIPYVPKPWWPALLTGIGVGAEHVQRLMAQQWDPIALGGFNYLKEAHPQPKDGNDIQ